MKEIRHYMLPLLTEKLYEKEAISSIALTKDVASKINELVEAYNTLYTERLAKYQEQDGKIQKGILYMKDNLANTLYNMFEIMKINGDIEGILNEFIPAILRDEYTFVASDNERVNGVNSVKDVRFPYGNVKRYGAVGDGVTDDTKAIQNAAIVARENGMTLMVDEGTYKISSDVDFKGINTSFKGDIITDNDSKVIIGNVSTSQNGFSYSFEDVNHLWIEGLKNSDITFNNVNTLTLYADGDKKDISSVAYCTITGNVATNVILESVEAESIGWINENRFNIKRIQNVTIDGNYSHNNNHFEHCNLESSTVTFKNSRNNYFSARGEGAINLDDVGNKEANFIEKEYYYKMWFANPVTESENNTVIHYPVNKLQTERVLLHINKANKHFPIENMWFNADGTFTGKRYAQIFHSGITPLTNTIGIKLNASHKAFRTRVNFYDENMNIIESEDYFDGSNYIHNTNGEYKYYAGNNIQSDRLVIHKNKDVKYFDYMVMFGDSVDTINLDYVTITLVKYTNTDTEIDNKIVFDQYKYIPTSGYWERGTVLYNSVPTAGGYAGIICVESGEPGVWKKFGLIES